MRVIASKVGKRLVTKVDKIYGILLYDLDNKYPQNIKLIYEGSGTAMACIRIHTKFLTGKGFALNGDKVINSITGLTLDRLHARVAPDWSYFRGFSVHINYNANFSISSMSHIPFQHCRLGVPDDKDYVGKIAVYNNWDRGSGVFYKKSMIDYIDIFNPKPEIVQYQVEKAGGWDKYKGQVLWISADGSYTYPKASLDPVLEDVETDAQLKEYKYKTVLNRFSAGHMLVYRGSFENDEVAGKFIDRINDFLGSENAGSMFMVECDYDEQIPEIAEIKQISLDKAFEYTEKSIQDNIRKMKKVPPVLIGDLVVGRLGTAEEIADATMLYNAFTEDDRKLFEDTYSALLKMYKNPIKKPVKIEPISIVSDEALAERLKLKGKEQDNASSDKE